MAPPNRSSPPCILYAVYEPAHVELGLSIAAEGRVRGFYTFLWCPYFLPETPTYVARAAALGSIYVHETTSQGSLADVWSSLSGWLTTKPLRLPVAVHPDRRRPANRLAAVERLTRVLDDACFRDQVLRAADSDLRRVAFCEDVIVRLGIDCVVSAEESASRDTFAWIEGARRRAARTILIAYDALSPDFFRKAHADDPAYRVGARTAEVLVEEFPRWIRQAGDHAMTRLPLVLALGRELAGLGSPDPWRVNTEEVDALCVESPRILEGHLAYGYDPERLVVTGHPHMDRLAAGLQDRSGIRRTLTQRHGLADDKPLIVVAMPPNQFAARRPAEFASYGDLVGAFAAEASRLDAAVIVTPHPATSAGERQLMRSYGVAVAEGPTAAVLPAADLFINSVSTTMKWALACGIPVVNYDCYQYGYRDYDDVAPVATVHDRRAFSRAMDRWADPDERVAWRTAAAAESSRWGLLDGRCMERVLALMLPEAGLESDQPPRTRL